MKRRHWLQGAGAAAATAGLAACGRGTEPAAATDSNRHWSLVSAWPAELPGLGTGAATLAAMITRASGGRLTVTAHAAGEKVEAFDVFDAVARGTVEMGHSAAYFWQSRSEACSFFCAVPFGLDAAGMNAWLARGEGLALWRELYAPFNLVPFAAGNTGMQMAGWFRREIRSLSDLAGLKMRIPGLGGEVMARLGVATVNLPGAALVAALESGQLDATEWMGPWNDLAFGLHRVAKYCYYPGWQEPGTLLECVVNKLAFDALPDDLQAIVADCCAAFDAALQAEYAVRNQQSLKRLRDEHKVDFRALPRDVLAALRRASDEVLDAIAARDAFAARVLASVRAFQADSLSWRRVSDAPWLAAQG